MENKESNDIAYSMENDPLFRPISEDKKRVIDKKHLLTLSTISFFRPN